MANICGYWISDRWIFMALVVCAAISIVISSTHLMQSKLDMIVENLYFNTVPDDVYYSEKVFRINYGEMEKKLKIYIYPQGKTCSDYEATVGKYASEGYFFKNIRESAFFTDDPNHALLFFIPLSLQKIHHKEADYEKVGKIAEKCVKKLIREQPYWNRTLGADHVFLACLDHDVRVPSLVKNTIRIVCASTYASDASRFIPHKDITLPSVMQPFTKSLVSRGNDMHMRKILGFWAGVCNSGTRKRLASVWGQDQQLNIQNSTELLGRMRSFYRSKFCICPVGSRISNSRITLAIHHGCVPVIMDDYLDLPFNDILDWGTFSVVLRERDIYLLKGKLSILAHDDYKRMHRNLMKLSILAHDDYKRMHRNLMKVKRHFEWNTPPVKYDAFHMVMYDLWLRHHIVKY